MAPPSKINYRSTGSSPWFFFLVFLTTNLLLSFASLSVRAQMGLACLGLILPFLISLRTFRSATASPFLGEMIGSIPVWALIGLALLALFIRFYKLTTLSGWLNFDDALYGYLALDLLGPGGWRLNLEGVPFYSIYPWGLAVLFKIFHPSLFWIWFYPAFLSSLTIPVGYFAARVFFPRSFSFLITLLLAFSFWPLYLGRMGQERVLVFLVECLALMALGHFLKEDEKNAGVGYAIFLGLVVAVGSYVHISWVAVGFFLVSMVVLTTFRDLKKKGKNLIFFFGALMAGLIPFFGAGLVQKIMDEITFTGVITQVPSLGNKVGVVFSYVSALLWGVPPYSCNGSVWGGYLNPILGSFFLLGLVEMIRHWRKPIYLGLLVALVLFFIPPILTASLESHRLAPELPITLVVCGIGIRQLLGSTLSSRDRKAVALLLALIAVVDFYHLAGPYYQLWGSPANWEGYGKSLERYRAYEILDEKYEKDGPGYIFTDFVPGLCDQSLWVAVQGFNLANRNSSPSLPAGSWIGVFANINYLPFLRQKFPMGKARWLSVDLSRSDGGWMLFLAPLSSGDRENLADWMAAAKAYHSFPDKDVLLLRRDLMSARPFFSGDPFLESCYWEKMADLDFKASSYKDPEHSIMDIQKAIRIGFPAAHLYFHLGGFYMMDSNPRLGAKAFLEATRAPLDQTRAKDYLQQFIKAGGRS